MSAGRANLRWSIKVEPAIRNIHSHKFKIGSKNFSCKCLDWVLETSYIAAASKRSAKLNFWKARCGSSKSETFKRFTDRSSDGLINFSVPFFVGAIAFLNDRVVAHKRKVGL